MTTIHLKITYSKSKLHLKEKLDESTACRHLNSPRSLCARSLHLTLVTKWSWSWTWMTYSHPFVQCQSALPSWHTAISKFDHENPWSRSRSHLTLKIQRSRSLPRSNLMVSHIWGLKFNRYVCFSFRGNWAIFGWDVANSIFDLVNSRSRSWRKSTKI